MKIALVSPYDFAYPGGVVNHIVALEKRLIEMGHDVTIFAPTSKPILDYDNFIKIGNAYPYPVKGTTLRISTSLNLAPRIKEILEQEDFDIFHLHEPCMPMVCSSFLKFATAPIVGTFHASGVIPNYYYGWPITTYKLRKRRPNIVGKIAVSKPAMEYAQKYVPGDYQVIPNGIDLDCFNPNVEIIEEFNDDKLNILFVGRLEKRKGLKYLIDAYKIVKEKHPNSRLIVIGPGTRFRKKYEAKVKRDNLEDVHFLGKVSAEDLPRYFKTADIYCSPAVSGESFGIVLLEAMAVGTAIVASDIPGYRSVLTDDKEGLLVRPRRSKLLAKALDRLLSDKELRLQMGQSGIETSQIYDWNKVALQVYNYYLKVLVKTADPKDDEKKSTVSV
ncbi:MAG: glycosyltransferase family 4 protein [Dehalococcoidales bacterium]